MPEESVEANVHAVIGCFEEVARPGETGELRSTSVFVSAADAVSAVIESGGLVRFSTPPIQGSSR